MLGAEFGNVVVAVQPAFGYEGDPMRLLFGKAAQLAPSARFLPLPARDFGADAVFAFPEPTAPRIHARKTNGPVGGLLA